MLHIICGGTEREPKVESLIDGIKEKYKGIEIKIFDAASKEEEKFMASIAMNSLFGGKELIILKRGENVKKIEDIVKEILKYHIADKEVVIDIEDEELKAAAKISKIEGNYKLIEVKNARGGNALADYAAEKLMISWEEASRLTEVIGNDFYRIKNEIEKIMLFLNGEEYSYGKVEKIISKSKEYNIFEVCDELWKGKKKNVYEYLSKSKEHMGFLYMASRDLQIMVKMKILEEEGVIDISDGFNYQKFIKSKYNEIKGFLPYNPYVIFKKISVVTQKKAAYLRKMLGEALEAEYKIKSGIMEEGIAVELFVKKS